MGQKRANLFKIGPAKFSGAKQRERKTFKLFFLALSK